MNKFTVLLLAALPLLSYCQKPGRLNLIPEPVSATPKQGGFLLNEKTTIVIPANEGWDLAAEYLKGIVRPSTGLELQVETIRNKNGKVARNRILFVEDKKGIKNPEGYKLDVSQGNIVVRAGSAAGAFYAVQTIRQLFPAAINAPDLQKGVEWTAQACEIEDYPRFGYRGMHLDVSRHWFPVSFVKRYIDLLAAHKMNRFHWHLTDDQGWRIEIKKYPRLQEVAACREQTLIGHYTDQPVRYDGIAYCHFYTQEEVKEVVEYARKRFVTIVPEIEMPGHALAALTAYPELGCLGAGYETATNWGVFDDVFCAGNEAVFSFLEGVIAEVSELFPGEYFHIGGDECPKTRWKECPKCQATMKKEGLKDEHELQSYFIHRAERTLAKYGKKLIGWDEILEGGLSPNATVMSWRGVDGGIAAAKAGHDVIMTPGTFLYFDYYQGDPNTEPVAIGGSLPLEKVYGYDPIPEGFTSEEANRILGIQANLWTEYIASPGYAEYMAYPRACALAELAWSPWSKHDWNNFTERLTVHFDRLNAMRVNYAKCFYDVKTSFANGKVNLECAGTGITIHYTTDGSEPNADSPVFSAPFPLTASSNLKAAAWQGGTKVGNTRSVEYLVHKASGKPYTMTKAPKKYDGGEEYALTNGVTGGIKSWSTWVGLVNHNFDPVIDLGVSTNINRVTTHYVNSKQAWIHPPKAVEVFISDDGKNFKSVGKKTINPDAKMNNGVETVTISVRDQQARYIKLVATTRGVIPEGHPGAGEGAWLFLDEIIVE